MNLRNLKIFGWKELVPRKKKHIFSVILIIVVIALAFFFVTKEKEMEYEDVTVIPREDVLKELKPEQEISAEQQVTGEPTNETIEEEEEELVPPEDRTFADYKGQCANDLKKAEDDINDITAYSSGYQQRYDNLTRSLEEKLKEIEELFGVNLPEVREKVISTTFEFSSLKEKIDNANKLLEEARKRRDEIKAKCDEEFYS